MEINLMTKNRARKNSTRTSRKEAIRAVEETLKRINFATYSKTVVKDVKKQAEIYDRVRARSLAAASNYVFH